MSETETKIIAEFTKNEEQKVRLGLRAYKGRVYFDLRLWFASPDAGKLLPTRRGICLSLDYVPEMRKLMEALESAKGVLPEESPVPAAGTPR